MVSIDDVASKEEAIERFNVILQLSTEIFPDSTYFVVGGIGRRFDINKEDTKKTVLSISLLENIMTLYDKEFESEAREFKKRYKEVLNDDFNIKKDYCKHIN